MTNESDAFPVIEPNEETQRLLDVHLEDQLEVDQQTEPFTYTKFIREGRTLGKLAWPVIGSYTLSYSLNVASVFSLGHFGNRSIN